MVFITGKGRKFTLTIHDARFDLSGAQVKAVMDHIIRRDVFAGCDGSGLVARHRAYLITTEVYPVNIHSVGKNREPRIAADNNYPRQINVTGCKDKEHTRLLQWYFCPQERVSTPASSEPDFRLVLQPG